VPITGNMAKRAIAAPNRTGSGRPNIQNISLRWTPSFGQ
jgi:hypothetical protein